MEPKHLKVIFKKTRGKTRRWSEFSITCKKILLTRPEVDFATPRHPQSRRREKPAEEDPVFDKLKSQ
jgi:hypothetical protein